MLACGLGLLAWMLSLARPGAFFSGDGGLKLLLVQQFASGELAPDLRLRADLLAWRLWDEGGYPFGVPFVYDSPRGALAWTPLPFLYLVAPAYALLGWRGLYLWPAAGVVMTWLLLWRACRRLDLGPGWTSIALVGTILGSPLTVYGAIFWEHSVGVALAFAGVTVLLAPVARTSGLNGLLAGLLTGFAVWVRSEMVWWAVVSTVMAPFARRLGAEVRGFGGYVVGLAAAGAGLLTWNSLLYGNPLGIHATPVVAPSAASYGDWLEGFTWIAPALLGLLAKHGPVVLLGLGATAAVLALGVGQRTERGSLRFLVGLTLLFAGGVALILPNGPGGEGGKQFGPRYLLLVFPVASIFAVTSLRSLWLRARRPGRIAVGTLLVACLGTAALVNVAGGGRELARDYGSRVSPALEALRAHPWPTVVVSNQFVALELAALFEEKRVVLAASPGELATISVTLSEAGEPGALLAIDRPCPRSGIPVPTGGGGPGGGRLLVKSVGCPGDLYCVCEASLSVAIPR